jgi:hypothetical protein
MTTTFPFVETITANDNTIDRLHLIANACGIEDLDWTWEWRDGGKYHSSLGTSRNSRLSVYGDHGWSTQILNGNKLRASNSQANSD